jgi:hypothetical protein
MRSGRDRTQKRAKGRGTNPGRGVDRRRYIYQKRGSIDEIGGRRGKGYEAGFVREGVGAGTVFGNSWSLEGTGRRDELERA